MSGEESLEITPTRFKAGFALLDKFQNQWEQIHSTTITNVGKARTALTRLNFMEDWSARHLEALDRLIASYQSLPKLDEQILAINNDLETLERSFSKIEELLIVLTRYKEERDAQQHAIISEANYERQVLEMQNASRERREGLKQNHLRRVEAYEREQQKELEERRHILERAFEEEKTRYLEKAQLNPKS